MPKLSLLTEGLKHGWATGVLLGLLDAVTRVIAKNFEWFELYLALLLPGIIGAVLFGLIGGLLSAIAHSTGRERVISGGRLYSLGTMALLLCIGGGVLLRHRLLTSPTPGPVLLEAAALILLVAAAVTALRRQSIAAASKLHRLYRGAALVVGQTVSFATLFILTALPIDLYLSYGQLPPTAAPAVPPRSNVAGKPYKNLILISLDTVRADRLSLYSPDLETTPFLKQIGERAAVFENALATSSWTLPSHASIFTGQTVAQHDTDAHTMRLSEQALTLTEILQRAGYLTTGFVGGPYCKSKYGFGQGFDHLEDRLDFFEYHTTFDRFGAARLLRFQLPAVWRYLFRADGRRTGRELNKAVLPWLKSPPQKPFFLFINYFDAHDPYDFAPEFLPRFTGRSCDYRTLSKRLEKIYYGGALRYDYQTIPTEERECLLAYYDSQLFYLDQRVAELFETLQSTGLLEDSVVVLVGDHGEEFFDHGGVLHRQTLYQEVLKVPLLLYAPGLLAPARYSQNVSIVDVLPTVLTLLGVNAAAPTAGINLIEAGGLRQLDERSLTAALHGNAALEGIDLKAVIQGRFKLVLASKPAPRIPNALYDLEADPQEQVNLWDREVPVREKLFEALQD